MVIRGVFTDSKLSPFEVSGKDTVAYRTDQDYKGLKKGDLVRFDGYDKNFQVVWTFASSSHQDDFEIISINTINGKQVSNSKSMERFGNMDVQSAFGDLTKDMYNEFMPQAEESAKISITDGVLCFKNSEGSYVGMSPSGKLKKYKLTYPMPCIYNISKNANQVVVGDIVKTGKSYGVVKTKAEDGSIKIMNFNGNINNKVAIEDELMGSATFRVIVNPFNFDSASGFNPLALAFMNKDKFDVKNLLIMSAMNGGGLFDTAGSKFNPIMLLGLADDNSSDFITVMLLSQLMGNKGTNPFANMFGQQPTVNKSVAEPQESKPEVPSELEKVSAKVDKLTEAMASLVNVLTANVQPKKEEDK